MQHFELRLSFQISPSTAPATQSDTWTSPSTAPTTQSDTWTSPSTAPTTILLIDSTITQRSITQRFYSAILLITITQRSITQRFHTKYCAYHDSINWLYYYSAIYYAAILLSDSINWLYYYSAIYYSEILLIVSTITQRFY